MEYRGHLRKMSTRHETPVNYHLVFAQGEPIPLNPLIGKSLALHFTGAIACTACGKALKKAAPDGLCFPCSRRLASADLCQTRPELCHHHRGTCREPQWAMENCFIPHTVYLANASGLKVGITRTRQERNRWMDQGAAEAIPLGEVQNRLHAGLVEVALKAHYDDRTDWRGMLRGAPPPLDLEAERKNALALWPADVPRVEREDGPLTFTYPKLTDLAKIASINLEKAPQIDATLLGIKGQYLIFDVGVVNIRRHQGFEVIFQTKVS